jgi:hypothetical protein
MIADSTSTTSSLLHALAEVDVADRADEEYDCSRCENEIFHAILPEYAKNTRPPDAMHATAGRGRGSEPGPCRTVSTWLHSVAILGGATNPPCLPPPDRDEGRLSCSLQRSPGPQTCGRNPFDAFFRADQCCDHAGLALPQCAGLGLSSRQNDCLGKVGKQEASQRQMAVWSSQVRSRI